MIARGRFPVGLRFGAAVTALWVSVLFAAGADPVMRLQQLNAEIARHDELYFRKAQPEISDVAYDRLKREFEELREQHPEAAAELVGAVSGVGDDRIAGFPKHRHRVPMLSLNKAYAESELRAFAATAEKSLGTSAVRYVVEPKFDGVAISVTYERGRLVRMTTRGNGTEGDDVTVNATLLAGLPRELRSSAKFPAPDFIEVRGEVFMTNAEFARLNQARQDAGAPPFASPRNLAAGTLKSLDAGEVAERKLDLVIYGVGGVEPAGMLPDSQSELRAGFVAWGLPTVERVAPAGSIDAAWSAVQALATRRPELAYPIDGVVLKIESREQQRRLDASEHAPRWAIAFKFTAERATTRLRAIAIQVGRTGVLTPVAELDPVAVGGATISRASLHNAGEIARLDLRVGDVVIVERSGEVIPAVVGVQLASRSPTSERYVFLSACPACGEAALNRREGALWRCVNPMCEAQLERRLLHFASTVGIEGMGEATIKALVGSGKVRDIADLFDLRREDLTAIAMIGPRKAELLVAALETSRRAELWRFVHGLGIHGVGSATAKALIERFRDLAALTMATETELMAVRGVGEASASAIRAYFAANQALIARLQASEGTASSTPAVGAFGQ